MIQTIRYHLLNHRRRLISNFGKDRTGKPGRTTRHQRDRGNTGPP